MPFSIIKRNHDGIHYGYGPQSSRDQQRCKQQFNESLTHKLKLSFLWQNNMADHGYQDVIDEVDALCGLFLHSCFSALASSPMDVQYVQGLSTLPAHLSSLFVVDCHQIPQLLHVPSICKPWKRCPRQPYWSYHPSELDGDDLENLRYQSWLCLQFYEGCLRMLRNEAINRAFKRFMDNPNTSRKFYASPEVRHGRIAKICLRELISAAEYCICSS